MTTLLKKSLLPSLYQREVIPSLAKRGEGRFESGFTLIELLITMVVFVLVIAAASGIFTELLTQFKQQSKIAETNIEGIVGLDMLRRDIEHAGYGLPWGGLIAYNEAASAPESNYNDSTTTSPPRAFISGNNVAFFAGANAIFNGTDYLIIKASNVARSDTAQRWTHLRAGNVKIDDLSGDSFVNNDRVIVLSPSDSKSLVTSAGAFYTLYNSTSGFQPSGSEVYIIYGVDPDTSPLRMPFNRADYFVRRFDGAGNNITPQRCNPNTGVLEKATVNQGNGALSFDPLLDCVADMQVVYRLDMNEDGTIGTSSNADGSSVTTTEGATVGTVQGTLADASLLRSRLKEVRVYILAHEGQYDRDYRYREGQPNRNLVNVQEPLIGMGRVFDLITIDATNWQNYRWKVYTLVIKPNNLR